MIEPWMSGSLELLQHAEGHLRAGSDFDKRMAFISFDNAIETTVQIYFTIPPKTRGAKLKTELEPGITSFSRKIDVLETYVTEELKQETKYSKTDLLHLHDVRNQLYHNGNGVVPEVKKLRQIREAGIWVFNILYGIDPTPLMAVQVPLQELEPNANPSQVQFIQQFNEFRAQLTRTVEATGLKRPTVTSTEPEYDWDLFLNRGEQLVDMQFRYLFDSPRLYDRTVQEAVLAWRSLTKRDRGANLSATDEYYASLGIELSKVTSYLKSFLVSPDFLHELEEPPDSPLKAMWIEIAGGEVLLKFRQAWNPDWKEERDMIVSFSVSDPPDSYHSSDDEFIPYIISPLRSASDNAKWIYIGTCHTCRDAIST